MVYFYPGLIRWDVDFKLHPWRFFMSTPDFLKPWFIRRWPPKKCFSLMSLYMLHKWWVDITTLQNILKYGWDDQDWQNEHWPEKVRISGSEIGVSPEKMGFNGVDMRLQLSAASLGCFFYVFFYLITGDELHGASVRKRFFYFWWRKPFRISRRWYRPLLIPLKELGYRPQIWKNCWVVRHHS